MKPCHGSFTFSGSFHGAGSGGGGVGGGGGGMRRRRHMAVAAVCGPSPLEVTSDARQGGGMNRYVKDMSRHNLYNVGGAL